MEYDVRVLQSDASLGVFPFEEVPQLGCLLGEDCKHVIASIHSSEPMAVYLIPRITVSKEKPFMTLDWHLGAVFCAKCTFWSQLIEIHERVGFCPRCGPLTNGTHCMDMDAAILEFNRIVSEHPCICEHDCENYPVVCEVCAAIPVERAYPN